MGQGQSNSGSLRTAETSYSKSSQSKALVVKSSTSRPEVVEGSCVFNGSKVEGWYVDKDKGVCVESNTSTGSNTNTVSSGQGGKVIDGDFNMRPGEQNNGSISGGSGNSNIGSNPGGAGGMKQNPYMCMDNPINQGYQICVTHQPKSYTGIKPVPIK